MREPGFPTALERVVIDIPFIFGFIFWPLLNKHSWLADVGTNNITLVSNSEFAKVAAICVVYLDRDFAIIKV